MQLVRVLGAACKHVFDVSTARFQPADHPTWTKIRPTLTRTSHSGGRRLLGLQPGRDGPDASRPILHPVSIRNSSQSPESTGKLNSGATSCKNRQNIVYLACTCTIQPGSRERAQRVMASVTNPRRVQPPRCPLPDRGVSGRGLPITAIRLDRWACRADQLAP
jgi:hypothetical protein